MNNHLKSIIASLFMLAAMQTAWADGRNWMASLPDNVYITQLSIPGAHDAATSGVSFIYASYAKTQSKDINGLWDAGVRAFDLRPKTSGSNGPIYHGTAPTGVTLRDALGYLQTKLADNPQEFAIVIIRNEGDSGQEGDAATGKWHQVIAPILESYNDVLTEWHRDLTLGDVRGKIIVLARDEVVGTKAAKVGGWPDNTNYGTILLNDDGAYHIILQDYYENINTTTKNGYIKTMLDESMTIHCPNRLYINHTSGYTGSGISTNIEACAKSTNKYVCDYLDAHPNVGPTGIIMMDFAGDDGSSHYGATLVNKIIANNNSNTLLPIFSGPEGEYFLQNVETGLWIQGYQAIAGADRNRWNTAANVGSYGRPFLLQNPANDGWTLNTQAGSNELGCEYGDAELLYLDWNDGGARRWKITGTKDNAYITINHDRWLSVDNSNPCLLRKDGTTRNAWKLWTRAERLEALSEASEANPIDVSWLIVNPELMNNDRITPQWTEDRTGGDQGWRDGFRPNRIYEAWNFSSIDFHQTISVPNGVYEVQAYALYSPTGINSTNINDYNNYKNNGQSTVKAALYANKEQVPLPSIYSYSSPTSVTDYATRDLGGVFIINGWEDAARAMGEDHQFHSAPLRVIVTDGTLRLGIKNTSGNPLSNWVIIGSFSLKYLGTPTALPVTVSSKGMATFSSPYALDFSGATDIKAYRAEKAAAGTVTFQPVTKAPANTGLLLVKEGGATEEIPVIDAAPAVGDNLLVATVTTTTLPSEAGFLNYVLADKSGAFGFFRAANNYRSQAGKAYLRINANDAPTSGAKGLVLNFGDETGVTAPVQDNDDNQNTPLFNLAGQRVSKAYQGIVIQKGRKVVL
jgi:hypothetical protein